MNAHFYQGNMWAIHTRCCNAEMSFITTISCFLPPACGPYRPSLQAQPLRLLHPVFFLVDFWNYLFNYFRHKKLTLNNSTAKFVLSFIHVQFKVSSLQPHKKMRLKCSAPSSDGSYTQWYMLDTCGSCAQCCTNILLPTFLFSLEFFPFHNHM